MALEAAQRDLEAARRELDRQLAPAAVLELRDNFDPIGPPPAPPHPQAGLIARRLDTLASLCANNPILTGELMPFLQGATEWDADADGLVTGRLKLDGGVVRAIAVERGLISIGREGFPERKRIPFA